MSLFNSILEKLGMGGGDESAEDKSTTPAESAAKAGPSMTKAAPAQEIPTPRELPAVDVMAQMESRAAANSQKLNWRTSIVDLLKLLDLDSSYGARKEMATELGCPAAKMNDSAQMNVWLHKTVLKKVAANGGNIPQELLD